MKIKRLAAYIIDFFIIYIIAALIYSLPVFENSYNAYQEATQEYVDYVVNIGSGEIDYDTETDYLYDMSRHAQPLTIINCGLIILYFGIYAYITNGQTIGKKIMKIKVVSTDGNKLNPNLFMLREIILTNLLPKIASIIALALLSKSNWILAENIIGYIQNTITFLIIGFMIFRDDERGLHDVICKTNVVSTK